MLLSLQDDGVLYVYASVEAAVREVEPLDAEKIFRAVFDETARPYSIRWIRANKIRRGFFGFFRAFRNGEYTLVPADQPDRAALLAAIRAAKHFEPADVEASVRQLERRLTSGCS